MTHFTNTHFTRAIVRTPSRSLIKGITSQNLGIPDYSLALTQHTNYIALLEECGLKVTVLPALEDFPDSCFVEDVALVTDDMAILTNPGASSRNGEKQHMLPVLQDIFSKVHTIDAPGTLDAGDVMMVDKHFYIGLSDRTNQAGAKQLIQCLNNYGRDGSTVALSEVLHLKTGINCLEQGTLIACGEFLNKSVFQDYALLAVDQDEAYAANSLWVNDTVIVPEGFPKTLQMIKDAGYKTVTINVSEFEKLDGGLSCLSLRF